MLYNRAHTLRLGILGGLIHIGLGFFPKKKMTMIIKKNLKISMKIKKKHT